MVETVFGKMLLTDDLANTYRTVIDIYGNGNQETLLSILRGLLIPSDPNDP
jgi:hypothetical protein